MHSRISVGDGFRVSESSSRPSNSSGGSDPDDIVPLSDIYMWGEIMEGGDSLSKIDVLIPKPLESNIVLDVHQIASGTHHHAIITSKGDVFTWGEASGGRLGHATDKSFGHPHQVEFLISALDLVACGENHTCVVSKFGDLFTWGDGEYNVGLLGHGSEASHWIPKKVDGPLEGLQVVSVACGTWHTALATSDGKMFTFGDGAFGVLGHGDTESVLYPKEVQLLKGLKTIKIACGAWHTAAIIEVMFQSGSKVPSWKLFTWGDGDKYCLGHGNKEMYLQPTRVSPLIEYNFLEIACGNTMTVALTTSGHVFTMGGTENGQLGNPKSAGKVPTLVQDKLLGEFVEFISCGAHHVAVLTSRSELYTWGKGANGRLGHGDTEDKKSPSLVVALKDRYIRTISCGSSCTSCICLHRWDIETDQLVCSSCQQAFGLKRKRHNCYHCGLAFCHACSSKKALKAILATSPEKPHRVCDSCYAKLKVFEVGDASKFSRKATPNCSIQGRDRLSQGEASSSRTLFSPVTEPMKYLEMKNTKPGTNYGSISFIRASQVPSHIKLKDIAFPSSVSSIQSAFKPATPPKPPQIPLADSSPTSSCSIRPSSLPSASPRFSGNIINSLRRTNNRLNEQVSNLQHQIQNLKQRDVIKDVEIQKLQKKATEAIALVAVESSSHGEVKEFIESIIDQMKEMIEKLPLEIPESEIMRTMYIRVENFLNKNSESEKSSLLSKLEFKQQNAPQIRTADGDISKLQENRLEENVDAAGVDPCQDGDETNGSTLDYKQQNARDIPTSDNGTSESQEHMLEENVNAVEDDPFRDEGNFFEEINGSKMESEQQNAPDILGSYSGTNERQEHTLEENLDTAGVHQSQTKRHVLQGNFSSSVHIEEVVPPQSSEAGLRSLEPSKNERQRQQEAQIFEKFEHGVYAVITLRPDGIKVFKRVKFSKRRFTENQAEEWWKQNKFRVLRKYCPLHQKLTTESCNITSHAKCSIGLSTSVI